MIFEGPWDHLIGIGGEDPYDHVLEKLKWREDELEADLSELKRVLALAYRVPAELKRHHSFVCECARLTETVADRLKWLVNQSSPVGRHANLMLEVATSSHHSIESVVEQCRDGVAVDRATVRECLHASKQVLDLAFKIRSDVESITSRADRVLGELRENAALIRAGARAIVDNMSADDAEVNVRHSLLLAEVPSQWILRM